MARTYTLDGPRRWLNWLVMTAVRLGIWRGRTRLLTVTGRKSGKPYTTPVNLVRRDGQRYIVSPYGDKSWAKNARAAGEVTLSLGKKAERRRLEEISGRPEGGAVLRQYFNENWITRPYFDVTAKSSDEEFVAESNRRPVFRLLE